jgi:HPt (histidine-containing phosphotransfer) domain-containing protein
VLKDSADRNPERCLQTAPEGLRIDGPAGDDAAVERLAGFGGPTLVQRMVMVFLEDVPRRLAALRSALDRGDVSAARAVGHSLKSSCAQLGAPTMHALSLAIENSEDAQAIGERLDQLPEELLRYRQWIAGIVPGLTV